MKKTGKYRVLIGVGMTAILMGAAAGCGAANSSEDIGKDKATQIALDDAGVVQDETSRFRVTQDRDDGKYIYEVEFASDGTEYSYEIQASDGKILEVSTEQMEQAPVTTQAAASQTTGNDEQTAVSENDNSQQDVGGNQNTSGASSESGTQDTTNQAGTSGQTATTGISWDEAGQLALARVEGATEQDLRMELEHDDGYQKYEGDIILNGMEYEFEIDASTGKFLEWSEERR